MTSPTRTSALTELVRNLPSLFRTGPRAGVAAAVAREEFLIQVMCMTAASPTEASALADLVDTTAKAHPGCSRRLLYAVALDALRKGVPVQDVTHNMQLVGQAQSEWRARPALTRPRDPRPRARGWLGFGPL